MRSHPLRSSLARTWRNRIVIRQPSPDVTDHSYMFTRTAYILLVICWVLSFGACKSKAPTSTPIAAPAAEQGTPLLLESFRNAHEKHDLSELAKLYCDDGVPHVIRTVSLIEEGRYFAMPITRMNFNSAPKQPMTPIHEHGLLIEPNLTQVGELEVEYGTAGETVTRYYPLGLKNGVYRIITSTIASGPDESSADTGALRAVRLPGKRQNDRN